MSHFYDFSVLDMEGKEVSMRNYADKVVIVVNVASQ